MSCGHKNKVNGAIADKTVTKKAEWDTKTRVGTNNELPHWYADLWKNVQIIELDLNYVLSFPEKLPWDAAKLN